MNINTKIKSQKRVISCLLSWSYHQCYVIIITDLFLFFFFSHAQCVGCVFLCPRNARVALACGSWRATTTRALRNRLLGSKDPPARSILRTTLYIYSPRHVSLDRTDPRFPSRGTVEPTSLCCPPDECSTALLHFYYHPSNLLSPFRSLTIVSAAKMIAWWHYSRDAVCSIVDRKKQ